MMHSDDQQKARKRILVAARKEFAERGFAGARMSHISKIAGTNQALIHYYFNNKENLYREVMIDVFDNEVIHDFKIFIENVNLTPPEKLLVIIYAIVWLHMKIEDRSIDRIILRELAEGTHYLSSIIKDYEMPIFNSMKKIVEDGCDQGFFQTENPLLVVLNMKFFADSIFTYKEFFIGTEWGDLIYKGNSTERMYQFLANHTFRALNPENSWKKLPELSHEILQKVEQFIKRAQSEMFLHEATE